MNWRSLAFLVLILGVCVRPASAQQQEQVFYYHLDAIGSVRMITDANQQVVERHDYLPFGQEWQAPNPPSSERRLFAGTERDSETTFDYLGARYYTYGSGRFTTVDPDHVAGDVFNPQTWNGYAYGLNNPLRYVDPYGYRSDCPSNTIDTEDGCTARPLFDLWWDRFRQAAQRVTTDLADATWRYVAAPRDPGCVAAWSQAGAMSGAGIGFLGLSTGPGVTVIEPGMIGAGGIAGTAIGATMCAKSANGGGSGDDPGNSREHLTADEIISRYKKASVRQVFPSEYLNKTLAEIRRLAAAGDRVARRALKLLTDSRFEK